MSMHKNMFVFRFPGLKQLGKEEGALFIKMFIETLF